MRVVAVAKNRRYERVNTFTMPVLAGVVSGSPVIVGMLPGVGACPRFAAGRAATQVEPVSV
jgi:hypothetical protein